MELSNERWKLLKLNRSLKTHAKIKLEKGQRIGKQPTPLPSILVYPKDYKLVLYLKKIII